MRASARASQTRNSTSARRHTRERVARHESRHALMPLPQRCDANRGLSRRELRVVEAFRLLACSQICPMQHSHGCAAAASDAPMPQRA